MLMNSQGKFFSSTSCGKAQERQFSFNGSFFQQIFCLPSSHCSCPKILGSVCQGLNTDSPVGGVKVSSLVLPPTLPLVLRLQVPFIDRSLRVARGIFFPLWFPLSFQLWLLWLPFVVQRVSRQTPAAVLGSQQVRRPMSHCLVRSRLGLGVAGCVWVWAPGRSAAALQACECEKSLSWGKSGGVSFTCK